MKNAESLFNKYEYLAEMYAKKIFNYNILGYDQQDVIQEFRIKMYEIILAYGRSIEKRKERGMIRPVPIPFYIKAALSNFVNDYIKKIKNQELTFSNELKFDTQRDYAEFNPNESVIDPVAGEYSIGGFDLLAPLEGVDKKIFVMYLKGTPTSKLKNAFNKVTDVEEVIREHKKYLHTKKELFELENVTEFFVSNSVEIN